jgi:hypothetical protein
MEVQMSVVLFVAKRRDHLAAPVTGDDVRSDPLDHRQKTCGVGRLELQKRPDVPLRHHDDVFGSETRSIGVECERFLRVDQYLHPASPRDDLVAVPVRVIHTGDASELMSSAAGSGHLYLRRERPGLGGWQ